MNAPAQPFPRPVRSPRPTGFTLVELLVVIAIVGVLAAITVPIVSNVRTSANTSRCLGNLRQYGIASALYAADHNGHLNYQTTLGSAPFWHDRFKPYVSEIVRNEQFIWVCPGEPLIDGESMLNRRHYGMSGHTLRENPEGQPGTGISYKLTDFDHPSRKVYMADVVKSKQTTLLLHYEFFTHSSETPVGKLSLRHGERTNLLFLDGHVRSVGAPPLPTRNDGSARNWLQHDYPPPSS